MGNMGGTHGDARSENYAVREGACHVPKPRQLNEVVSIQPAPCLQEGVRNLPPVRASSACLKWVRATAGRQGSNLHTE